MRRRAWFVLASLIATAASAVDVDEVKARGALRLISFPFPTNEFVRPDGDGFGGLDYDIAAAFAKSLGVRLEVVSKSGYGELIPALEAGEGDLVGSSFTITAARQEVVDFSTGYFPSVVQVVTRAGSSIARVEDLLVATAATVPGSSLDERLRQLGVRKRLEVTNSSEQFRAIEEGRADFGLADSTSVLTDQPDHRGLQVAFSLPGVTHYGFAFRKDSAGLRAAFDKHLQRLREGGYLYQLVRRHFGEQGVELFELAKQPAAGGAPGSPR